MKRQDAFFTGARQRSLPAWLIALMAFHNVTSAQCDTSLLLDGGFEAGEPTET